MAVEIPVFVDGTRRAAADLSALQYRYVKEDANGNIAAITADTDVPFGVLQNTPTANQEAAVMRLGQTKLRGGAALARNAFVGPGADGRAATRTLGTDVTKFVGGMVIEPTGAANELATASVNCLAPSRAV